MRTFYFLAALLVAGNSYSQTSRKVSTFLSFQVNGTTQDRTMSNNRSGFGFGLQTFLNTAHFLKPLLEVNGDFFAGTKELLMTTDGRIIESKQATSGIYIGPSFLLTKRVFAAVTTGPNFYNDVIYFGIRPSLGLYLSPRQDWMLKLSHTTVFQHDAISNEPFSYISVALALKLF